MSRVARLCRHSERLGHSLLTFCYSLPRTTLCCIFPPSHQTSLLRYITLSALDLPAPLGPCNQHVIPLSLIIPHSKPAGITGAGACVHQLPPASPWGPCNITYPCSITKSYRRTPPATPAGVNDGEACAHRLGRLLQGRDMHINLIPWNPVLAGEGIHYAAPGPGSVAAFQSILRGYGLVCTVRQEKGQDIAGACGQLVIETQLMAGGWGREGSCGRGAGVGGGVRDIEELAMA